MSDATKAEFERHCGPDCKFTSCELFDGGNRVEIGYEVPLLGRHFVVGVKTSDVVEAAAKAGRIAKDYSARKIAETEQRIIAEAVQAK